MNFKIIKAVTVRWREKSKLYFINVLASSSNVLKSWIVWCSPIFGQVVKVENA